MQTDTDTDKQGYRALAKTGEQLPPADGVFLVGGCVRDLLAGRCPADYDLAVSGQPEAYAGRIAQKHGGRPIPMGPAEHRVFRVVAGRRVFDVTPLAGDSIAVDLKNRDFTINAMAFDIAGQQLIDPENGRNDLDSRTIRAVSTRVFTDDPLRLLRAFRLAAQFGCRIETQTFQALKTHAALIQRCAGERIRAELLKLLSYADTIKTVTAMADCGLLFAIIPELAPLQACSQNTHHSFDAWGHTLASYRQLESLTGHSPGRRDASMLGHTAAQLENQGRTGLLKTALLLHDIGKPATRSADAAGRIHFYGHGRRGAIIAENICQRLKFSRRESAYVTRIVNHHNRPLFLFLLHRENRLSKKAVTRFFMQCGRTSPAILLHAAADFAGKRPTPTADLAAFTDFAETLLKRYDTVHTRRQAESGLITGRDLITAFDLPPSPVFKKILTRVEAARLSGEISDKDEALALARQMLDKSGAF